MSIDLKNTEASFSPNLIDSLCLSRLYILRYGNFCAVMTIIQLTLVNAHGVIIINRIDLKQEYDHSYFASVGVVIKNEYTCYDLINRVVSCERSIRIKINWMIEFELQLLATIDNYYVNSCSHHSADSHQLHGPGDTGQLSHFLSNLQHKD